MIHSMTGFGRAAFEIEGMPIIVEIRTVNHRHLDATVRLPRVLSGLEPPVRKAAQGAFLRGKVDCSVQLGAESRPQGTVEIDRELARRYAAFAREWAKETGAADGLRAADLLALPGVARLVEVGLEEEAALLPLLDAVAKAADAANAMRAAEGEAMDADLRARLGTVDGLASQVEAHADVVADAVRERLRKRADQLREETGILDQARLHQEIVIAADRLDVTEEVVRLRSHVEQFRAALDGAGNGEPVGRRLDFLVQEMGREANTVGSKSADAAVSHLAVDLKTELERIREQVQNIE